jgi:hypothetical protein
MNKRWLPWWILGYLIITGAVVWSLFAARHWAHHSDSVPRSVADWQVWRTDVEKQQTNPGPVERRVPKSKEPPALVLMRDHFSVSLVGALVFSAALYWVMAWLVTGMLSTSR